MAATPVISLAVAETMLNCINTAIGASGTIGIFSGAMPATTLTANSGTLLSGGLTFGATPFGAAGANGGAGGVGGALATANAIASDASAAATGTAGYFRVFTSAGQTAAHCVLQGDVGTSSADMILNTVSIVSGGTVAITAYTLVLPNG